MSYFYLPITNDADRTFSCLLGGKLYNFRMYYAQGAKVEDSFWLLDVYDAEMTPLALGRRLISGSINLYKGYANNLSNVSLTCGLTQYPPGNPDIDENTMNLLWITEVDEMPFEDGDPMDTLYENFYIAQQDPNA